MTTADIEADLATIRMLTDYLLTGACPTGVRPEVMELCVDVLLSAPASNRARCVN